MNVIITNSVKYTTGTVNDGLQKSLKVVAHTVNNAEPLEKVAKISERIIRVLEIVFENLSQAVSNLGSQLKDTIVVFETVKVIGIMKLLLCPDEKGKYFLTNTANSWQKKADRVTLAFHSTFKSVRGLSRFGFVELGVMAKNAVGKLPIFNLVMDSFIIASSFFSSWESIGNTLPKANKKSLEANSKIVKWRYRETAIALLKAKDEIVSKGFESKYKDKVNDLQMQLDALDKKVRLNDDKLAKALQLQVQAENPLISKEESEKIIAECKVEATKLAIEVNGIQEKMQVAEERMNKIANHDYASLAQDLEKTNIAFKIKKWEIHKFNAHQEVTKVWIAIANAIGKIAVVSFALVLTATNVWTAPFMLSLLFMGILVDSIGLSKILVSEFWKSKPIPVAPVRLPLSV